MLSCEINSVICAGPGPKFPSPPPRWWPLDNKLNSRTPCECYNDIYLDSCSLPKLIPEVLIYVHDDIEIFDPQWMARILGRFEESPKCCVVGLGGATSLGRESLYKRPYRISDMARGGYHSNQRDWNVHGQRLTGSLSVAVVDAFFMAVRTSFLTEIGGWPVDRLSHHCLDLWLACEAARRGKETWAEGVDCMHYGGGTSTKPIYGEAKWLQGGGLVSDHEKPHQWLWKEYRDVLPVRV